MKYLNKIREAFYLFHPLNINSIQYLSEKQIYIQNDSFLILIFICGDNFWLVSVLINSKIFLSSVANKQRTMIDQSTLNVGDLFIFPIAYGPITSSWRLRQKASNLQTRVRLSLTPSTTGTKQSSNLFPNLFYILNNLCKFNPF